MRVFRTLFPARWRACRRGAAAVEFALVGPLLILLAVGILSYGGYFWLAHGVQQAANDAARAAIAGLTDAERRSLAQATLARQLNGSSAMRADRADVEVVRTDQMLTVNVSYDAAESVFFVFDGLVPMPAARIERSAAIRLGGY